MRFQKCFQPYPKLILILGLSLFFSASHAQNTEPNEREVLVEILVTDNQLNPLHNETVEFFGRRTQKTYIVLTGVDGKAVILLPKRDVYEVSYKDLFTTKDYALLEVPEEKGLFTFSVEITYEPSRIFTLENVYFEFGKSVLMPESFTSLNELVELLKAQPAMEIEISGHTDNVGSSASNIKLSQDRAEAVRNYLIRSGISGKRIVAVGYGDTKPVASNNTDEGRSLNRRTEVKILKK